MAMCWSRLAKGTDRYDVFLLAGCLLLMFGYAVFLLDFKAYPHEDAAILMRYSENVANGHGVVWNVGEKPVDGATDFLFMIAVASLIKTGLTAEIAVRFIDIVSHVLTVVVVYLAVRYLQSGSRWMAFLSAGFLAIGPGLFYTVTYFGTPFFALFATVAWYYAIKISKDRRRQTAILFAFSGLVLGLIRPEGVILAILMIVAIVYANGIKRSKVVLMYAFVIIGILGSIYFFWRWSYFGYALPNPFYKKGGGHLYLDSLRESIIYAGWLTLPFSIPYLLSFRSWKLAAKSVFALIPIGGFVMIWILLSNEMNYFARFQYAVLPIVLMSWPPLLKGMTLNCHWGTAFLGSLRKRAKPVLFAVLSMAVLIVLSYQPLVVSSRESVHSDGRYDVAIMLSDYKDRGYTIATSEAGLLPFYSKWKAVDCWGLNDQWIAHHGGITKEYLDRYKPEIIMFHARFSPLAPPKDDPARNPWFNMTLVLLDYSQTNGYVLAAVYGVSPSDTHYYYVNPGFAESFEVISRIRSIDYVWWATGERCQNWGSY